MPVQVSFVGAGPGASDLITIRGARLLRHADVVIFAIGQRVESNCLKQVTHPRGRVEVDKETLATNVPGIDVCEHLPLMSQWMHKTAVVRSLNHKAGCHN